MSVYVDKLKTRYGRMIMSHMLADSVEELHAMADKIGLKRKWFQSERTPHYDLCQAKKRLAIKHGAIEVDRKKVVELIKRYRTLQRSCGEPRPGTGSCARCGLSGRDHV